MSKMFIVDLDGTEISEEEKAILQHPNIGGQILFKRNYKNPEQLKTLTAAIHAIRPDIFITVDHEGETVQRFTGEGFTDLPAAHSYGNSYDRNPKTGIQEAQHYGKTMASDLLNHGINSSLAPVIDLHHDHSRVIGQMERAFHQNPDVVITLASAFIQGMHAAGMPSVGKHFPGHGSIAADSHLEKPVSTATLAQLEQTDLKPFAELIRTGKLDAVMPAHVTYTAVDPDNPAGFSRIWLQDILRQKLGFQGLVMSDCLGMTGADIGDLHTRANKALEAGCDMLIACNQKRAVLHGLLNSIQQEQSPQSLQRIEDFKRKMTRFAQKTYQDFAVLTLDPLIREAVAGTADSSTTSCNNTRSV